MSDAFEAADAVIATLAEHGKDYATKRDEIADLFQTYLWNGNYDMSTDFADDQTNLRLIEETEYDQHMGDSQPDYLCYAAGHYVVLED